MSWFFLALVGPFLYALTNHIDKVLLEKHFKEGGVGALLLVSSLLSALALPFLFLADPMVFSVGINNIIVLAVVGTLNILVLWFYLLAIREDEASIAVVSYQLVPVFGLVLGYLVLDETLTQKQLLAMAIILVGATVTSFEIDAENRFTFRRRTVPLMLGAAFCWALGSVIFKAVALEENVLRSLFWEHLMLLLVGICLFFVRPCRIHLLLAIRANSKPVLSLVVANEVLYMLGNFTFAFAYMLAPVALVLLAESFQPIFVLAIGVFLTVFFPNISSEKIQARHLWQKIIAVCITVFGAYLLVSP